jgi:hypothetical protein
LISLTIDNRQEPTRRQIQASVGVEDDRREDEPTRPRSAANVGIATARERPKASAETLYEVRHVAERSAGT